MQQPLHYSVSIKKNSFLSVANRSVGATPWRVDRGSGHRKESLDFVERKEGIRTRKAKKVHLNHYDNPSCHLLNRHSTFFGLRGFKYTVSIDIPPLWGEERH